MTFSARRGGGSAGVRTWRQARATATTAYGFLLGLLALTVLGGAPRAARAGVDPKLAQTYKDIAATVDQKAMADTIRTLSTNGSRVVGYPGERAAADYAVTQLKGILGDANVQTETFNATVPMDNGAQLTANGHNYTLYSMWPNLVRTSQLPPEGLTGPLIYAGNAALSAFNGKVVAGSVVMVDFNCSLDWLNAARLGAKAVIFIEPDRTVRGEAEAKFLSTPLSIPRFYIKRSDAAALQGLALAHRDVTATLHADMKWTSVPARNFIGVLPGRSKDPKVARQIIVVQAFYDGMSVVPALAPSAEGAGGLAGLLQTARTFKKLGSQRTIWFVATSGHYLGLQGIRELINNHIDGWQVPGPFAKLFGQDKEPAQPIYLWIGLDLASQSRAIGIFYKGWFFDVREDTQNLFSDIARVARENNEKVASTFGYDPKVAFADGVNPVDGKSWRNFIPGKPAFDSEVVGHGRRVRRHVLDDRRFPEHGRYAVRHVRQDQCRQSRPANADVPVPVSALRERSQRPECRPENPDSAL